MSDSLSRVVSQNTLFSNAFRAARPLAKPIKKLRTRIHLALLRRRVRSYGPNEIVRFLDYTLRITDGPNFYIQYKDEFIRGIYHFKARRENPLIIDGGSNMGMSILYFKRAYPLSRIIGFEPDPSIFPILEENMARNRVKRVRLVNAGLGAERGTACFLPDGSAGGHIAERGRRIAVRVERLSDHLNNPVDFLKLNIEGAELAVLQEAAAAGKLPNVREMVLEYHGWADGGQRLGEILNLLDRQGFRYLVHDFDDETNGASKPPFHLDPMNPWFCLVYAGRADLEQ